VKPDQGAVRLECEVGAADGGEVLIEEPRQAFVATDRIEHLPARAIRLTARSHAARSRVADVSPPPIAAHCQRTSSDVLGSVDGAAPESC
jgi:hypothetical protein